MPQSDVPEGNSLWRNGAFRRLWTAATISIFGSLITRLALPLVAILTLHSDAFGVALVRGGIFGATFFLLALDELGLDAAAIGIVAAVGGVSSLFGAVLTGRLTKRLGIGRLVVLMSLIAGLGSIFIPLAPAGAPLIAMMFLIGQQLVTDPAATIYDITDTSIRQSLVHDRQLGRVNATVNVAVISAQLAATLGAGVLALVIGLRETAALGVLGGALAALILWRSPVRRLRTLDDQPVPLDPQAES